MAPALDGLPAAEREVDVSGPMARFLVSLSPRALRQIRLALRAFEVAADCKAQRERGCDESVIRAILSHNTEGTGVERERLGRATFVYGEAQAPMGVGDEHQFARLGRPESLDVSNRHPPVTGVYFQGVTIPKPRLLLHDGESGVAEAVDPPDLGIDRSRLRHVRQREDSRHEPRRVDRLAELTGWLAERADRPIDVIAEGETPADDPGAASAAVRTLPTRRFDDR